VLVKRDEEQGTRNKELGIRNLEIGKFEKYQELTV
jgi:hypothetical protein